MKTTLRQFTTRTINVTEDTLRLSPPVLRDISFRLPSGQLTVIVGITQFELTTITKHTPPGESSSGKTSLLSALLRELRQLDGERELEPAGDQYSRYALLRSCRMVVVVVVVVVVDVVVFLWLSCGCCGGLVVIVVIDSLLCPNPDPQPNSMAAECINQGEHPLWSALQGLIRITECSFDHMTLNMKI